MGWGHSLNRALHWVKGPKTPWFPGMEVLRSIPTASSCALPQALVAAGLTIIILQRGFSSAGKGTFLTQPSTSAATSLQPAGAKDFSTALAPATS